MPVEIDPSYLGEIEKKGKEAKRDKLVEAMTPDKSREVNADLSRRMIEAWKTADELVSEAELAASVLEDGDEQQAVAEAKHEAATMIKGAFARAAQAKTPMEQYGKILQELAALKTRFASEDGEIGAAKQDILADFTERMKSLISG